MSLSQENDRYQYAQELTAYTLRQFAAARLSEQQYESAKYTTSVSKHIQQTKKAPDTLGGSSHCPLCV